MLDHSFLRSVQNALLVNCIPQDRNSKNVFEKSNDYTY